MSNDKRFIIAVFSCVLMNVSYLVYELKYVALLFALSFLYQVFMTMRSLYKRKKVYNSQTVNSTAPIFKYKLPNTTWGKRKRDRFQELMGMGYSRKAAINFVDNYKGVVQ